MTHIDPAIIEFALWNATVRRPQDRLILLAVGRWRRIWKEVTPSIQYIADEVGVSRSTAAATLKWLSTQGMITVTRRRSGHAQATNMYDINPQGCIDHVPEERRATLCKLMRPETASCTQAESTSCTQQSPADGHKTRTRENSKQEPLIKSAEKQQQCVDIYMSYPRRVGKGKAIESIAKALDLIAADQKSTTTEAAAWLLDKVKQYAASPAGKRGAFTPHPSTWMNQQRYDDDAIEWNRTEQTNSKPDRRTESTWGSKDDHLSGIEIK
jgi:hypothetical protein